MFHSIDQTMFTNMKTKVKLTGVRDNETDLDLRQNIDLLYQSINEKSTRYYSLCIIILLSKR